MTNDPLTQRETLFHPGDNCWRVATAEKLALIVDACRYFEVLRKVILSSRKQLLLVGWDFDLEIEMLPGESDDEGLAPDGYPNKLAPFLEEVIARNPDLQLYMLKWNGAVIAAPGRLLPTAALAAFGGDRIHFALDGHHPFGACHHQKIVVADDRVAFCGGIDATDNRWDTSEHLPDNPLRVRKDGTPSDPWHDATSALSGPIAAALGDLSRRRWHRATGETLEAPAAQNGAVWPEDLEANASNVDVAIARTEPPYDDTMLVNEIEQLFLETIRSANDVIYIESQYFAAETICAALEDRLTEPDGPQIVIVNPLCAMSAFEDDAMHTLRDQMITRLKEADHEDRFRIYYPVTTEQEPIYVHAKILIADTDLLHLGSANLNDRSMGFDTECNIVIQGKDTLTSDFRARLLAEHLGASIREFEDTFARKKSLIATIETLNDPHGRGLREIENRPENALGKFLAATRLMDPRYMPGQSTSAGQGIRPRHVALLAGGIFLCYLGWKALRGRD